MKRRLELARALLPSPEVILLDEPTTGLDPDSEQALWAYLRPVNARGATVLLATNDVGEAERQCDTVAFIHQGRLVAQGSPADLKANLKRDAVFAELPSLSDATAGNIRDWPDVGRLTWSSPTLHVTVDSAATFVPRLFEALGDGIRSVRVQESTLEDAYFEIVGACIRDGGDAA
jgi:ABC-2 type transport system ATP-binding protein